MKKNTVIFRMALRAFNSLSVDQKKKLVGTLMGDVAFSEAFKVLLIKEFAGEEEAVVSSPVSVVTIVSKDQEAPEIKKEPVVVAPPVMEPARMIRGPEKDMETWLMVLQNFLSGQKIDPERTRDIASRFLGRGISPSSEDWEKIIFPALKKAGHFAIIDSKMSETAFRSAPEVLLREYLFGGESLLVSVLTDLADQHLPDQGVQRWLVAKSYLFAGAVHVLDSMGGLTDWEVSSVESVIDRLEALKCPQRLIDQLEALVYEPKEPAPVSKSSKPKPPAAGGLRIVDPLSLRAIVNQKKLG